MRKKNKFLSFISFIIALLSIAIFVIVSVTALDILGIVDIPEQYSLTRFLTTSKEITAKDYSNIVEEKSKPIQKNPSTSQKNENTEAPLPEHLQAMYEQINDMDNSIEEKVEIEKYYYKQLETYGKIIYDKMYSNIENLKTGTYIVRFDTEFNDLLQEEDGNSVLEKAFQSALNALIYDNPELFYIDITKMYLYTETTTIIIKKTYKIYIGPEEGKTYFANGFNSREEVENAFNQIEEILRNIKDSLAGTEQMKIKTIHNYLIDTIEYDQTISKPNIYNIYGALVNKVTVCEGYAKSLKYILDNIGINSMFVCGIGTNSKGESENHAWNYVELDGNWYAIDVTWDDPILIGGGWLTDEYRYKYFLNGSNKFYNDHKEDGNILDGVKFYYPVLSQKDY